MYYGSRTVGRCWICAGQTLRVHSPDGRTFCTNYVMAAILKIWRHITKSNSGSRCLFTWRTISSWSVRANFIVEGAEPSLPEKYFDSVRETACLTWPNGMLFVGSRVLFKKLLCSTDGDCSQTPACTPVPVAVICVYSYPERVLISFLWNVHCVRSSWTMIDEHLL